MLGRKILILLTKMEREGRSCRPAAESTNCRLSGGKRAFDPTAFDIVERQCQLAINHTLRNQGNRSPFDLRLKEISYCNARFGANPAARAFDQHPGFVFNAVTARRFGMKTVILPALNEADIIDIPEELRRDLRFVFARTLEDVLAVALGPKPVVPTQLAAHGPQDVDA